MNLKVLVLLFLLAIRLDAQENPNQDSSFYELEKALETPEKVALLVLNNQALKEIPDIILKFPNLSMLILQNNELSTLPVWLPKCKKLKHC